MNEKWTHRAVGAGVGAIVMLFALPFGAGWYTAGGAHNLASAAVTNALLPLCVEAVLANPAAVAELKVKRLTDYDDVVRDHLKTIGTYKTDLTFWRACGKLLEGKVDRTASKQTPDRRAAPEFRSISADRRFSFGTFCRS